MKHIVFFVLFLFISVSSAFSQCAGCLINTACTATPAAPALCPDILPDATQGTAYDTDVTFFIPQQFYNEGAGINVTLSQITITSVSGLPAGMSWTASESDNIFDITSDPLTQRGCVKICGTPVSIGSYTIAVNVIATITSPINTTSPQTFTLPLLVLPGGGGNSGFSFEPSSGCDSLTVNFQGLITSTTQPVQYTWDFGNGQTSSAQVPPSQVYAAADTYFVSLQTDLLNYVLESVSFNATGTNWCGDVEESSLFGVCLGSPDIYFELTVGSAVQQSSTVDNNTSFSQSGLSYVINEPSFSMSFFDEDLVSANDALGATVLQVNGAGTFNFTTNQGYGSYTIGTQVGLSFTNVDTVIVFPSPVNPIIQFSDSLVCEGDSILLSIDPAPFQQWYLESAPLFGSNANTYMVHSTGNYQVEIRNEAGCDAFSSPQLITVAPNPNVPTVFLNPITGELFCNPGTGLNWEWYLDGELMSGSSNLVSFTPSTPGNYSVEVVNSLGCSVTSPSLYFTNVGLNEASNRLKFRIYPQPFQSGLLTIEGITQTATCTLLDATGRIVATRSLQASPMQQIELPVLAKGAYILKVNAAGQEGSRLFMVAN